MRKSANRKDRTMKSYVTPEINVRLLEPASFAGNYCQLPGSGGSLGGSKPVFGSAGRP